MGEVQQIGAVLKAIGDFGKPIEDQDIIIETPEELKRRRERTFEFLHAVGFTAYETMNILKWPASVDATTESALRAFAKRVKQAMNAGHGITLAGVSGSGKSTIAAALAFHVLMAFEVEQQDDAKRIFNVVQFTDLVELLASNQHGPFSRIVLIDNVRPLSGAEVRRNLFENYVIKRDAHYASTWLSIQTITNEFAQCRELYPATFSRQAKNLLIKTREHDYRIDDAKKLLNLISGKDEKQ